MKLPDAAKRDFSPPVRLEDWAKFPKDLDQAECICPCPASWLCNVMHAQKNSKCRNELPQPELAGRRCGVEAAGKGLKMFEVPFFICLPFRTFPDIFLNFALLRAAAPAADPGRSHVEKVM